MATPKYPEVLWVQLVLVVLYVVASFVFAPCEYVMIGLSHDPLLVKKLFPVLVATFVYKDVLIIAVLVYLVILLFINSDPGQTYDIAMMVSCGIGLILTGVGFYALEKFLLDLIKEISYKGFNPVVSTPYLYDGIFAGLIFLVMLIYILVKFFVPNEEKGKYIEIVPIKSYDAKIVGKME